MGKSKLNRWFKGFVIVLIVGLFLSVGVYSQSASTTSTISPTELLAQIETETAPIILDVRSPAEYAAGHVPGAVNIDYRELPNRLDEVRQLQGDKDRNGTMIVVYCERGVRARIADTILSKAGFKSIFHLEGDMSAWRTNELPTDSTNSTPPDLRELAD